MPHLVDQHVGMKIRQRRWLIGMTQQELGEAVGIKFQQIQKYESGANRVSASRLWDISVTLDVPISFFFDGLTPTNNADQANAGSHNGSSTGAQTNGAANGALNGKGANGHSVNGQSNGHALDVLSTKETTDLVRAYYGIDESQRRRLLELAKAMGNAG